MQVTLCAIDAPAASARPGQLLDINHGGARLLIDELPPADATLQVHLLSAELNLDLAVVATGCWNAPRSAQWILGCKFAPPLPEEGLRRLFACGLIERRSFTRAQGETRVTARWQFDSEFVPAALVDLSDGGFCLRLEVPAHGLRAHPGPGRQSRAPQRSAGPRAMDDGHRRRLYRRLRIREPCRLRSAAKLAGRQ